jgi:protein-S-isoprenylcysteine O-methyltransferase Ste14
LLSIGIIVYAFLAPLYYFIIFYFVKAEYQESKEVVFLSVLYRFPRVIIQLIKQKPDSTVFLHNPFNHKETLAILSIVVKVLFFPLMFSFFLGHWNSLISLLSSPEQLYFSVSYFDWLYNCLFHYIFLIDTAIFSFGYLFESQYLKNDIKSVDPFLSGWLLALICYPPFNSVTDHIFFQYGSGSNILATSVYISVSLRIIVLLSYIIYVWATIALGFKASNLTNRGIVWNGPYRFVRHPAYIAKNIAWICERLPYVSNISDFIPIVGWASIYWLRALTEERHLIRDLDYKKYVQKVTWRFIPGIY